MAGQQKDRVILVTGASRGIGRAALRALAEEGAHVVATARGLEALAGIEAEAKALGGAATPVACEMSEASDIDRLATAIAARFDRLDGLFGNAGQINYAAGKAGIVGMTMTLAKEWGRLDTTVNCVAFGFIETRLTVAAGKSTANIDGREIKVGINRELKESVERTIPLGRAGTPEDAAGAIYLFCAPESDYVSGQTLLCSGGVTGV